jgi:hypothetical protein
MKIRNILLMMALAQTVAAAEGKLLIRAVAVSKAPQIDGRLIEPCYSRVPAAVDFVQFHPLNGTKAAFATEVYVCFDQHNLYIAFCCHDPEPGKIRADVAPFAGYENNDEVAVLLDPFADQRNYVIFSVNPRGIRAGQDTIWKAAALIDGGGWSAEIAIPFKSLRFPVRDIQEWGINLRRSIFRLNETDYWAPVNREQESILASTFGVLAGLRDIRGGHNLEVFPYAGLRDSRSDELQEQRMAFGLDLKYGITSNLTLDLTAAPDYSDVESDPFFYQTDPYEYALTENRPFYSENADFFSTAFKLFYSRRIVDPQLALKVTGKEGGYSLGALFAKNKTSAGDRFHGVLRVKKDIFHLSTIGVIYSAIEGAGDWNRNMGFDFQLKFRDVYTFSGFAAFAFNEQGEQKNNGIFRLLFAKTKKSGFCLSAIFDRVEPDVRVPAGYIPLTDYQKLWVLPKYLFLREGRFLERVQLTLSLLSYRSISTGEWTGYGAESIVNASFKNQLMISASYFWGYDRPRILGDDGKLVWNRVMYPMRGPYISIAYNGHRLFQAGVDGYINSGGVYSEDFREAKEGRMTSMAVWANVKLSPRWQWEFRFEHSGRVSRDRSVDFEGNMYFSTLRWQVSRNISSYAKFQYDSQADRFGYDFLVLFEPAPVSRMVLSLKNYCEERFRFFEPQARTLAIKLSYLIRI